MSKIRELTFYKGYPSRHLKDLCKVIMETLKSDRDFFMVIDGPTGEGKSTLAQWIRIITNRMFKIKSTIEETSIYNRAELREKFKTLQEHQCVIADEAMNILFSRDAMKGEQKEMIRLIDMIRDRHLIPIFCLPSIWGLDRHFLNSGRVRVWVHIVERGRGYIFMPDNNAFTEDVWHRKENEEIFAMKNVRPEKSQNYYETVLFPNLPPEIEAEYRRVKLQKRKDAESGVKEDPKILKIREQAILDGKFKLLAELHFKDLLRQGTLSVLAKEFNLTSAGLSRKLKVLVGETEATGAKTSYSGAKTSYEEGILFEMPVPKNFPPLKENKGLDLI